MCRFSLGHYIDAGYHVTPVSKGLEDQHIKAVFGYRRPSHRKGYLYKREYQYDAEKDHYICPQGQALLYRTTSREGYRHYQSDPDLCRRCPCCRAVPAMPSARKRSLGMSGKTARNARMRTG